VIIIIFFDLVIDTRVLYFALIASRFFSSFMFHARPLFQSILTLFNFQSLFFSLSSAISLDVHRVLFAVLPEDTFI